MELKTQLLAGLFMLLAAVPETRPQIAQSGLPTVQVPVHKTGNTRKNAGSQPTGATAGSLPGLCFQPGIGWQHVLTREPDGFVARDTTTSMGPKEHDSASGANPPLVYSRLSNVRRTQSVQCPEVLKDKKVTGASVEDLTVRDRPRTVRPASPTNAGTLTSLQVHSPYYPSGGPGLATVRAPRSVIPSSPTSFAPEDESGARSNQAGDRVFHAYLSSIKLRRLIRNTTDFRTRIKLQQLQNNPASPSHARRALNGEHGRRMSSRRSHTHDRSQSNSRSLGARP
jgi:hypothetical protein